MPGSAASASEIVWTSWRSVPGMPAISAGTLAELLDGGQAFRWHRRPDGTWLGVWADCVARLSLGPEPMPQKNAGSRDAGDGIPRTLRWSAPRALSRRVERALPAYLACDADFGALADALPWRSDAHLARSLAAFPGLRILRQPFGETLLGFICSATKQIVQIKQMLALLAVRHGAEIAPGIHRLPTWAELALVSEDQLRGCLLGFRARHIHRAAAFLAARPGWLDETARLPYPTAKERLCALPGVGEKIADCALLFGAARLEAFPVDVWVLRALQNRYALDGWSPAQIARFGRAHFGPHAGLAQQFLFAFERRAKTQV
ncbi:DNA-binding protein [Termitidicoccus mucosus]|uniref:DNA-(apurinic or apyrimidinic site) lyase n=1 Tax=Termitidicoccus mucosus TaxID=1184151 RepID=A0A178IFR9_9BACT|nr:DNA-binding protein [Opitutaceae bacterium TSB47]